MSKTAKLYRMATQEHICPFGLKSKHLLKQKGFNVEDHKLRSRQETDDFKQRHNVSTTPQVFIEEQRIGGYDDLRSYFKLPQEKDLLSRYTPIIVTFTLSALMVSALMFKDAINVSASSFIMNFIGVAMVLLALQKLQDIIAFSNQFITYDLLAMKHLRYAYVYPFAEAYAGLGMLAGAPALFVAPVSIFIGFIGTISVIKAVYIDKRALKCACVGGNSDLPLGFISLSENIAMLGAGTYMLINAIT